MMQTIFLGLSVLNELIGLVKYFMKLGSEKKVELERKALKDEINKAVDKSAEDMDKSELANVFDPPSASDSDKPKSDGM